MMLIVLSIIFSIAHGAALPGAMYVFGDLTNLYVNYDISLLVFSETTDSLVKAYGNFTFDNNNTNTDFDLANMTRTIGPNLIENEMDLIEFGLFLTYNLSIEIVTNVSCLINNHARENNQSIYDTFRLVSSGQQIITPTAGGCDCLVQFFRNFSAAASCLTDETFINGSGGVDGILWTIYLFLIVTVGVFIVAYFQISFMQAACERQVQKMRLLYYRSVLRQEIGWFDLNPSGEVSSRLNESVIVINISTWISIVSISSGHGFHDLHSSVLFGKTIRAMTLIFAVQPFDI